MAIEREERAIHWDYVLSLEEDLIRLSRFIDFSGNDEAYSIEIARLLMAACAEVDAVLKQICLAGDRNARPRSINSYRPIVLREHPGLTTLEIRLDRYGLKLRPWSNWAENSPPLWWTANNRVKHERDGCFRDGNLKNCLNAMAGLFAAVLYLYRERAEGGLLHPHASLFRIPQVLRGSPGVEPQALYYRLP